jgi:hypothetical protein
VGSIILSHPWNSPPGYPIRAKRSFAGVGVAGAYNFLIGLQNLGHTNLGDLSLSSDAKLLLGVGLSLPSTTSYAKLLSMPTFVSGGGVVVADFVWGSEGTNPGTGHNLITIRAFGDAYNNALLHHAWGEYRFNYPGGTAAFSPSVSLNSGKRAVFGYMANNYPSGTTTTQNRGSTAYVLDSSGFHSCGSGWASPVNKIEVEDTTASHSGLILRGLYVLDAQIADASFRGLVRNPWQIFEPLPRRIWVASAGGGPVDKTASDACSPSITEAQTSLLFSDLSDALSPGVTESASLLAFLGIVDTLSPSTTEASGLIVAATAAETLTPSLTEAQGSFVFSERSDTFTLSISEAVASVLFSTVSDTLALSLTETGSATLPSTPVDVADALSLSLTEAQTSLLYSAVLDALSLTLGEAQGSALYSSVTDVQTVSITDTVTLLLCSLSSSDTLVISITDSATATEVEEGVKSVSDALSLSLLEVGSVSIFTRWRQADSTVTVWSLQAGASNTWSLEDPEV